MAGRFARSWALMKASVAVLRSDRSLLAFPLLSGLCTVLVAATFLVPVVLSFVGGSHVDDGRGLSPVQYAVLFAFYLVQYFVIIFFNTALAGSALRHLRGEPTRFADGIAVARSRWVSILGYALITATVGLLLRALQERLGLIGRLVVGMIGLAWTVATFLVVPVLASQEIGPADAVKRSVELLKRTWGENLIGNAGMGLVFGLATFLAALLSAALIGAAAYTQSSVAIVAAIVLAVVGLALLSLIQASLQGIYSAALYCYAENGRTGAGFDQGLLEQAFRTRRGKR